MTIVFSASKSVSGKVAYKNYEEVRVESMSQLGEMAKSASLSSFMYGPGVTESGEQCEGHRAFDSIVGAGNVFFFDFDAKGATFEDVCEGFKRRGVAGWAGPSKSWSPDVLKFHAAVLMDREVPWDKDAFKDVYKAVAAWMGWDGWYDPAMESASQQMAPNRGNEGPVAVFDGSALDMAEVMSSWEPVEAPRSDSGAIEGELPPDTVFTLSSTGEQVTVAEVLDMVSGGRKVRVHCIAGLKHDGRDDTALVRGDESGSGGFYHCTGGRCGKTFSLWANPFAEEEDEGLGEEVREGIDSLEWVQEWIGHNHPAALGKKASSKMREAATYEACRHAMSLADIRIIEGSLRIFDGQRWVPLFDNENQMNQWIQKCFMAAGFVSMAGDVSAVSNVRKLLMTTLPVCDEVVRRPVLNVGNGMVNLRTGALEVADKEQLFCSVLPFDYDPSAVCPTWEIIVDRIMLSDADLIDAFQQACGYLFAPSLWLEVMIGFVGDGANGKSTVIEVLHKLVGADNASSMSLHLLTKPTGEGAYARACLAGKMINFTNELSPAAVVSSEFKELISGTRISARHPYGRQFVIPVVPKMLCAMNSTTGLVKETTHGFIRRLHLIPFNYTLRDEHKDPLLMNKLEKELPGILNWVLKGVAKVYTTNKLKKAEAMERLLEEVVSESDDVQHFLAERCFDHPVPYHLLTDYTKAPSLVVSVSEIYYDFKRFLGPNPKGVMGRNDFSKRLEALGVTKIYEVRRIAGEPKRVSGFYIGVKQKTTFSEISVSDEGKKPKLTLV